MTSSDATAASIVEIRARIDMTCSLVAPPMTVEQPPAANVPLRVARTRRYVGDRTHARARHEPHVLAKQSARVSRRRRRPACPPCRKRRVVDVDLDKQPVRVDRNGITFLDERNRAARIRFRCDVSNDHSPRAARKTTVGYEPDRFAEALSDQRRRR